MTTGADIVESDREHSVPDASAPVIDTRSLRHVFRDVVAVDDVDLAVRAGAVFGLLGPDGAGKSTLIRMLATVLPPDAGEALVFGESTASSARVVTRRIGYMSQRFSMYPDLTIAENLEFFATIRGIPRTLRSERAASLLQSMGLAEFAERQAQYLSGGMKQKLMLAATLMHEPDLLLLDEPTTGVDPVSRREFWRIIAGLHRAGKTVLVATPYMDEAERCTDIAFMDAGRIVHRGTPGEVKALVPGRLYEVITGDPRAALAALESSAGVSSAHLLGDVVRVLCGVDGPDEADLAERLYAAGSPPEDVRRARIDMEAVFTYLAETSDAPDPSEPLREATQTEGRS